MANNKPKGPSLYDLQLFYQAGIDPNTGLPIKASSGQYKDIKSGIKTLLRIKDEQTAVNRYKWGTPKEFSLTSQQIERAIYYKSDLCLFYWEDMEQFYILPYALDGGIDVYGRFSQIHPVPLSSGTTEDEKRQLQRLRDYLSTLKLKVLYDTNTVVDDPNNYCVLIRDYTNQQAQTSISRATLNDCILDVMSECVPYMRTALRNSTGIQGIRVDSQDEQSNVYAANYTLDKAALSGEKYIPITGASEFQDLSGGDTAKADEFMQAFQSLDNFRLSLYGIENGGVFQKHEHILGAEQEMNASATSIPMEDGLRNRKNACELAKYLWNIDLTCDINKAGTQSELIEGMEEDTEEEEVPNE